MSLVEVAMFEDAGSACRMLHSIALHSVVIGLVSYFFMDHCNKETDMKEIYICRVTYVVMERVQQWRFVPDSG